MISCKVENGRFHPTPQQTLETAVSSLIPATTPNENSPTVFETAVCPAPQYLHFKVAVGIEAVI
ncbi:MAG: hypothetical protein AAF614_05745 [Chloroflexota bacterium]